MIRMLFCLLFMCTALTGFGQTKTEEANRAVFNKIEFFINTQMTDSIYHLASEAFQEQVTPDQFTFMLQYIYPLGRITDVEVEDFKGQTATYRLYFADEHQLLTKFAIDSTFRYTTLSFTAAEKKIKETELPEKKVVIRQVETETPLDFHVDSVANSYISKQNTQSLAIAVFHQNKYRTFLYGKTAAGNDTLPTENTPYEIGALKHLFTATVLAELIVKDTIGLEESIINFLPDSLAKNPSLQDITFKTIANHTSSLPENLATAADRAALFNFLKDYQAPREPGTEYAYSETGYALLEELIATISQKPYSQYVQEVLLDPLQLDNTTAQKSTLRDLMLFAVEHFKMPENSLQEALALTRQFTFFTPDNTDIGLAWHMSMLDGVLYLHQIGETPSSSAFIGISPDTKTVVITLSNAAESVTPISIEIMEKLLGE